MYLLTLVQYRKGKLATLGNGHGVHCCTIANASGEDMAKPNYRFDKRQRELQKSRKKEEKRQKKLARSEETPETPASDQEPTT